MTGWFIDGNKLCNPRGECLALIPEGLSAIKRAELREFIEDGIRRAVAKARYEWEHERGNPDDWEGE